MTYNTSLKCNTEFVRVFRNASQADAFGDDVYTDLDFNQIYPDPNQTSVNHSVQIVDVNGVNYINLGANKDYVIFGCIGQASSNNFNQVIAVDINDSVLNESDGFFSIQRNYGTVFPTCTDTTLNSPNLSTNYLRYGRSRNYTFKIIKSIGNTDFKFKFKAMSSADYPLDVSSQVLIIEMSQ